MNSKIGVMQGRLLPKYKGRYQAHPVGYWQEEFRVAQKIGLGCIEFILDFNEADENPLLKSGGVDQVRSVIEETGVEVKSVCADYFMESPLHAFDEQMANNSQDVLQRLVASAADLGVSDIVIPCVDQASLSNNEKVRRFVCRLTPIVELAEECGVNLSLETDLSPQDFAALISRFQSKRVTVNYDIGNSAALGYDSAEELDAYGEKITDIHIKDRLLGGGPVMLGKGVADFDKFFCRLKEFDYQGLFIMQAYRDEEGVEIFKKQLDWIKCYISA